MGGFDKTFYLRFYICNLYSRFHDKAHDIYSLSQVVRLLHRCERQGDGFRSLSLYVDVTFGRAHADDAVVNAVYPDIFSAGVLTRSEKTFVHALAYDAYLSRFPYIHVIDKAAVGHFLMFYLFVLGVQTFDAAFVFVFAVNGCLSPKSE